MDNGRKPDPTQRTLKGRSLLSSSTHALMAWEWPSRQHLFLIVTGVLINIGAVAAGVHGAFGVGWLASACVAVWLIALQTSFYHHLLRNGLLLGIGAALGSAGTFFFNFVLAAAGLTALTAADGLGERWVRESLGGSLVSIRQTSADMNGFAGEMEAVARYSLQRNREEVDKGGTCGPSGPGAGPVARLREDDAATFAAAQKTVSDAAARARDLGLKVEREIGAYSAANHQRTVDTIAKAMAEADELTRDPGFRGARNAIAERLEQVSRGRPDRLNPALPVHCLADTHLAGVLRNALAIPEPRPLPTFEPPPQPSEKASVQRLFKALSDRLQGIATDIDGWRFAFCVSWIPDALFGYGLALHARAKSKRRLPASILEGQAGRFGLEGPDAQDRLARAMADPAVMRLHREHMLQVSWCLRTDWLIIDASDTGRCRTIRDMVDSEGGRHGYVGPLKAGHELPPGAVGFEPGRVYRMFALKPGIWSRLEHEAIEMALNAPVQDPAPSSGQDAQKGAHDGKVAA